MARKKKTGEDAADTLSNEVWPKVKKGTHLTVYTYENGSTKLEWDDEQLRREILALNEPVKKTRKAKAK